MQQRYILRKKMRQSPWVQCLPLLLICLNTCIASRRSFAFNYLSPKHQAFSLPRMVHSRQSTTSTLYETTFPDYSSPSSPKQQNSSWNTVQKESQSQPLPWGPKQEWALRDNISKYTVYLLPSVSIEQEEDELSQRSTKPQQSSTLVSIVLWRSLLREVTELSGYDISTVKSRYHLLTTTSKMDFPPPIQSDILLPFLDQYEFQIHGGVSGLVYGMPGVLDGTRIETSSLIQPEYTLPQGFIQTQNEYVAYELGLPWGQTNTAGDRIQRQVVSLASGVLEKRVGDSTDLVTQTTSTISSWVQPLTITFLALTGSTALLNVLSHHLTVNVFWV
jgi:hypothetical protein